MGRDGISSPPPAAICSQSPPCPGWNRSQGGGTRPGWFMLTAPSPAPARSQRLDFNHGEKPKRDPPGQPPLPPKASRCPAFVPFSFQGPGSRCTAPADKGLVASTHQSASEPPCQPPRGSQRAAQGGRAQDTLGDGPKDASDPTGGVVDQGLAAPFSPPHPGFPLPSPLLVWRWPPSQAG